MTDPKAIKDLAVQYEEYARRTLKPNRDELKRVFKQWKDPGYWRHHSKPSRQPAPSPVQRAVSRIKRPESVIDKILRKPSSFPDGLTIKSVESMDDALGARVIVYFLSNLPLLDHELRTSETFEVSANDPPQAYLTEDLAEHLGLTKIKVFRKDSGYASLHYTLRFRPDVLPHAPRPWFELQVRTLAEDVWGEIEHILGYKPGKHTSFAVRKQFRILASELTAIDEHFNLLYEELSRFQQEGTFQDQDPLNAENLAPALSEFGIGCSQSEIDGLLKVLSSRGIGTVGDLRDGLTGPRLGLIQDSYLDYRQRQPNGFETVAAVAAIRGCEDDDAIRAAVRDQIDIVEAWYAVKSEINKDGA